MFKYINISVAYLKIFSIFYLSISFFLFFYAWLKLPYFLFFSVALGYLIFDFVKNIDYSTAARIPVYQLFSGLIIVAIWVSFSGAGGFGYQTADFVKTNALDKDFMIKSFPTSYTVGNQQLYLAHYLGYFLPSPFILGSLGWKYVQLGNYLYTLAGACLSIFWFLRLLGKYSSYLIVLFIVGSGIQIVTILFQNGGGTLGFLLEKYNYQGFFHWINGFGIMKLTYLTNTDMLFWSATHGLACWLAMGMLLNDWLIEKSLVYTPFYLMLISFWSPLVLVGLVPYFLFCFFQNGKLDFVNFKNFAIVPIVFIPIALFLTSIKASNIIHNFLFVNRSNEGITLFMQLKSYVLFLLLEVFVWWVPSYLILKNKASIQLKQFYWLVLLLLCVIPLFRYGVWNDWCTRVSMPSLYALYFMVGSAFIQATSRYKYVLRAVLLLAAIGPLIVIASSFKYSGYKISWKPPVYESIGDIPSICVGFPVDQFVTDKNTLFFKYLAK